MNTNPLIDIVALYTGGIIFMIGISWCVYKVLKIAHDEDPGCLDPRH